MKRGTLTLQPESLRAGGGLQAELDRAKIKRQVKRETVTPKLLPRNPKRQVANFHYDGVWGFGTRYGLGGLERRRGFGTRYGVYRETRNAKGETLTPKPESLKSGCGLPLRRHRCLLDRLLSQSRPGLFPL